MKQYAVDLHRVTFTPACRPKVKFTVSHVEHFPTKQELLTAIDCCADNARKELRDAEKEEDEIGVDRIGSEIDDIRLIRELIQYANIPVKHAGPLAVQIAGTQIGTINFQIEEVWVRG
jgi:hypothetical protein